MLSIHGRTRKQMSKVPADWQVICDTRKLRDKVAPETLIVGNGDIRDRHHGLELAKKYDLDGIMIGRGVFDDPFAFAENSPWPEMTAAKRIELYKKHVALFERTWQNGERPIATLNKFCKIYINGFPHAKEMREKLMRAGNTGEIIGLLESAAIQVKENAYPSPVASG